MDRSSTSTFSTLFDVPGFYPNNKKIKLNDPEPNIENIKLNDQEPNTKQIKLNDHTPQKSNQSCNDSLNAGANDTNDVNGANNDVEVLTKNLSRQQKLKKDLAAGRFRLINEKLYTTSSLSAFKLFQENPQTFDEYHEGFRSVVKSWPTNPVDILINYLNQKPKDWIVADLGCGEGKIAQKTSNKVLSFDLVAKNDMIIVSDIAKLPIPNSFFDITIFCLSLMGTNYIEFLKEAHRVLKPMGELKIAEVVSRFSDINAFIKVLAEIGFDFIKKDDSNKMFIILDFIKSASQLKKSEKSLLENASKLLKPCSYKKR
ncbi:10507_t:CDS:2 [Diversispora eburnea]|uniref:Ribosomal RNA-processing protein 8 n=1 Tax=Diversispora eburnea TaxID=1213867 RepID=A0A9N8VIH7_9GLOM|nr:10507_t:CDS:2 [Diversispora eburnea]